MPIKIKGKEISNIKLKSNSVTKELSKVGINGKIQPVWESNRILNIAFDSAQIERLDYSIDGMAHWTSVYSSTSVSVPIGATIHFYSIPRNGYEEATPNETYWAEVTTGSQYPGKVYKCVVGNNNLELTLGAVAVAYTLRCSADSIPGVQAIAVTRTQSNFAELGALADGAAIYKEDQLQITYLPEEGYSIASDQQIQVVRVSGNYTCFVTATRKSYNLNFATGTSVVPCHWEGSDGSVLTKITCKYLDVIAYNALTKTVIVRDYNNLEEVVGTAKFVYDDDPSINEVVVLSEIPVKMPATNTSITGLVAKGSATDYNLNIVLNEGVQKVTFTIDDGAVQTINGTTIATVPAGSTVKLTAYAETGYTLETTSKTIIMGAEEQTVTFNATVNLYDVTFSLGPTSAGTGSWYVDGVLKGSTTTLKLHHGDTITRVDNTYYVTCLHSPVISNEISFVADEIPEHTTSNNYSTSRKVLTEATTITVDVVVLGNPTAVAFYYPTGISAIYYTVGTNPEINTVTKVGNPTTVIFDAGTKLKVWAEPASGYITLYDVTNPLSINVSSTDKTFDSTTTATSITLTFKVIGYGKLKVGDEEVTTLTVTDAKYNDTILDVGTQIRINHENELNAYKIIDYVVEPEQGYDYSFAISTYTTPVTGNQTITITGTRVAKTYKLTLKANKYISSVSCTVDGEDKSFVPTEFNDYKSTFDVAYGSMVKYKGIAVDGASVDPSTEKTFTMPNVDTEKTIVGTLGEHTITLSASDRSFWVSTSGQSQKQTIKVPYGTSYSINTAAKTVTIGDEEYSWSDAVLQSWEEFTSEMSITSTTGVYSGVVTGNMTITGTHEIGYKSFTVEWILGNNIKSITYKKNSEATQTVNSNVSVSMIYTDTLTIYATQEEGYAPCFYNKDNPCKYQNVTKDETFTAETAATGEILCSFVTSGEGGQWYKQIKDSSSGASWSPFSGGIKCQIGDMLALNDGVFKLTRYIQEAIDFFKFTKADVTGYNTSASYSWYQDSSNSGDIPETGFVKRLESNLNIYGSTNKTTPKKYQVNVTLGTGISKVYYKAADGTTGNVTASGSIGNFDYDSIVKIWAEKTDGTYNNPTYYSEATAYPLKVSTSGNNKSFSTTRISVLIKFIGTDGTWEIADSSSTVENAYYTYGDSYTITTSDSGKNAELVITSGTSSTKYIFKANSATGNYSYAKISCSSGKTSGTFTGETTFTGSRRISPKNYQLKLSGTRIQRIYYKYTGSSWNLYPMDSSAGVEVPYGSTVYTYAVAQAGYATRYDSESNYLTVGIMSTSGLSYSHGTSCIVYTVTLEASPLGGHWEYLDSSDSKEIRSIDTYWGTDWSVKQGTDNIVEFNSDISGYQAVKYVWPDKKPGYDYTYSVTPSSGQITSDITIKAVIGQTQSSYPVEITAGGSISAIYYKIGSGAWTRYPSDGSASVRAPYGQPVYSYVVPSSGWVSEYNSESKYITITSAASSRVSYSHLVSRGNYTVSFTTSGGGSWSTTSGHSATSCSVPYGSEVTIIRDSSGELASNQVKIVNINTGVSHTHIYECPANTSSVQYWISDITTTSSIVNGNVIVTGKTGSSAVNYNLNIFVGHGVSEVWYKLPGDTNYTKTTTNISKAVPAGGKVSIYGVTPNSAQYALTYTSSNPLDYTMPARNDSLIISASDRYYTVSFAKSSVGGAWYYKDSTSGEQITSRTLKYGTTWSGNYSDGLTFSDGSVLVYSWPKAPTGQDYTYSIDKTSGTVTGAVTITASVSTNVTKYTVGIYYGNNLSKMYYRTGTSGSWTEATKDVYLTNVAYGTIIQAYGVAVTGAETSYSSSKPAQITVASGSTSITITASLTWKRITLSVSNGWGSWSGDTTAEPTSNSFDVPYGTTVSSSNNRLTLSGPGISYQFSYSGLPSNTAQYTYTFNGIVNGSGTITDARTITASVSRTTNTYTISVYKGSGLSKITYSGAASGTFTSEGWNYVYNIPYGSTVNFTSTASSGYSPSPASNSVTVYGGQSIYFSASRQYVTVTFNVNSYNNSGGSWSYDSTAQTGNTMSIGLNSSWSISGNTVTVAGNRVTLSYGSDGNYNYSYGISSSTGGTSGTVTGNMTFTGTTNRSIKQYTFSFSRSQGSGSWSHSSMTVNSGTYWYISGSSVYVGGTWASYSIPSTTAQTGYGSTGVKSSDGNTSGYAGYNITFSCGDYSWTRSYTVSLTRSGSGVYWDSSAGSVTVGYGTNISMSSGSSTGEASWCSVRIGNTDYGIAADEYKYYDSSTEKKAYYAHEISGLGTVTGNTTVNVRGYKTH